MLNAPKTTRGDRGILAALRPDEALGEAAAQTGGAAAGDGGHGSAAEEIGEASEEGGHRERHEEDEDWCYKGWGAELRQICAGFCCCRLGLRRWCVVRVGMVWRVVVCSSCSSMYLYLNCLPLTISSSRHGGAYKSGPKLLRFRHRFDLGKQARPLFCMPHAFYLHYQIQNSKAQFLRIICYACKSKPAHLKIIQKTKPKNMLAAS